LKGPKIARLTDFRLIKNLKLGRRSLFVTCLIFTVLHLAAQSGGYLEFVENKGQWDTSVIYKADLSNGNISIRKNGFSILQHDTNDLRRIHELMHGGAGLKNRQAIASDASLVFKGHRPAHGPGSGAADDPFLLHSHVYAVSFEGANPNVQIIAEKPYGHHNNYILGGKKGRKGVNDCGIFQSITYKNLYDGIDLHYYTEQGFVKYDLVVHPGADPGKIVLRYDGQKKLFLRRNQVEVQTSVGTVRELEPKSYQVAQEGRVEVGCKYVLNGNRLRFRVGQYSSDATLVIDPTEIFCTFTGSHSDNWGYTATYDNAGEMYLGGIVLDYPTIDGQSNSGNEYGVTTGAFQSTYAGGDATEGGEEDQNGGIVLAYHYDVGISKFNSTGTKKLWATYLGGTGDEQPHSMVCDNAGNLIVTGRTSSSSFGGVTLPTFGPCKNLDLFVAKLSADGKTLMGACKIGGSGDDGVNFSPKYLNQTGTQELRLNYGDDGRSEVVLDASGNIYLAACTRSTDFYTTSGAFQTSPGGGDQDGVLVKLGPNANNVLFSSYLGGNSTDAAFVLALDPLDNTIWVAGGTYSTDLKNSTGAGSVLTATNNGKADGFIAVVSNDGSNLLKTSYFGTSNVDIIYGIGFDRLGYPYITGTTYSVIPVVQSPFNANGNQASGKQFITKLQPDLSGIVYSANFGPGGTTYPNISMTAFLIDRCQNVYVSGWGGGIDIEEKYLNSGTSGLTTTTGAIRATTDDADFYFFVLQKNAASQLYGTFFGQVEQTSGDRQSLGDHVDGGTSRFDEQGVIYQAICANCGGIAKFPVTAGAAEPLNGAMNPPNGAGCNEAGVKMAFNFAGVAAGLKVVTHGRGDSVGCTPLTATFSDTIRNARSYIWNFGDGTVISTTDYTEQHTYNTIGSYLVTLIAIDSNSCNVADTVTHTVVVKNNPAFLNFDYAKNPPCTSMSYTFTNLSTAPAGYPFSDTAFTWSFGDGTTKSKDNAGDAPTHGYPAPGPYNVTLTLNDTAYCNYPLDTTRILYVAQNVKASFSTPPFGCAPYQAVFTNNSIAGQTFYWNFGDGSPIDSVDVSPTHLYTNIGTYTISLEAVDSSTCNIVSDTSVTITVQGKPTAAFTYEPTPPQPPNTPTIFTDGSTPAVKYQWFFGDGTSEVRTTPDTVIHQYNKTDTFRVCLVVTNASGCTDTACHEVPAVINPLLDVPNAFTPGRFGQNAVIKVVGFGITHMIWRIYNRWGQVVFESDDPYVGWDGTYKGVVQPMDVYGYTLEAQYSDGTHTSKKGDITLIR